MTGAKMTVEGFNNLLKSGYLATPNVPTKINVGISTSNPTQFDTALNKKIPIQNTEQADSCDATTGWSGGTDSAVSLNTTIFKEGTGSLNIYKTGTTGTAFSASKTVTSLDFTSKDLWFFLYIEDITDLVSTGTAISIQYGSDNSNYYAFDIGISTLVDGWNYIKLNSSNISSTVGAPTITACDYFALIANVDLAADTVAEGDFMIDDIKLASSEDYDLDFDTDTLAVDETDNSVSYESTLSLTMANGYPITEQGHLTDDDALYTHNVSTADNKTTSELFIIKEKIKLLNTNL